LFQKLCESLKTGKSPAATRSDRRRQLGAEIAEELKGLRGSEFLAHMKSSGEAGAGSNRAIAARSRSGSGRQWIRSPNGRFPA